MRIALTGGIGSGKSTVSEMLRARGAVVVDADRIARDLVEPGEPALTDIVAAFGPDILEADGRLDRASLAARVFSDADQLVRLNAIMHPRIAERSRELLEAAPEGSMVVYDMPLLVEQGAGALEDWDAIVVVDAPDAIRLERLEARGVARPDAEERMAAQASREERLAVADHVLDNSGDRAGLEAQVDALWRTLTGPSGPGGA